MCQNKMVDLQHLYFLGWVGRWVNGCLGRRGQVWKRLGEQLQAVQEQALADQLHLLRKENNGWARTVAALAQLDLTILVGRRVFAQTRFLLKIVF